jgi:hypothetical protein
LTSKAAQMVYQTFKSLTKPKSNKELPEQSVKRLALTYNIIENYTPTQHSNILPSHNNSNNNNNNNNNNSNNSTTHTTNLFPQKVSQPTRNEQKPTNFVVIERINTNTNTNTNNTHSNVEREVKSEKMREPPDSDGPLPILEFRPEDLEKILQQFTENTNVTEVTNNSEELNRLLEYDIHSQFEILTICSFVFQNEGK